MNPKLHLKIFVVDSVTGQRICNCGCGHVVEERIADDSHFEREDDRSETRNMSRQYNKITTHDRNLTTEIGDIAFGRATDRQGIENRIFILQKWQQRIRVKDPKERRLSSILVEINHLVAKQQIPRILQEDASYLAIKWNELEASEGRPVIESAAALLCIASQRSEIPRMAESFECLIPEKHRKHFYKLLREIKENLGIYEIKKNSDIRVNLIQKICEKLGYPKSIQDKALAFLELWKNDSSISGKNPKVIAAVCICYFIHKSRGSKRIIQNGYGHQKISKELYNMTEVADAAGITMPSVRNTILSLDTFLEKNRERLP